MSTSSRQRWSSHGAHGAVNWNPPVSALIRPNVFTGITGGHLVEWNRAAIREPPARRRSEPWEHLRGRRWRANTYLNEMTLAQYASC